MDTTPTIRITEGGPEVGVATARLLLQHALEQEKTNEDGDSPEIARLTRPWGVTLLRRATVSHHDADCR